MTHALIASDQECFIMGIDPGTRVTGYGIVRKRRNEISLVDYGCICPPAKLKLSYRYRILFEGIGHLVERYAPVAVAVETQYVSKNVQSAIKLGMARGMAVLAATRKDIPIFEYAPSSAKRAVVGHGQASKEQVQRMIQKLLNMQMLPEPEDAADALALAICHVQAERLRILKGEPL